MPLCTYFKLYLSQEEEEFFQKELSKVTESELWVRR